MNIAVVNNMIEVEAASGVFGLDHCLIYLTLREKHATAEVVCSNPTVVTLRATEQTTRYSKLDYTTPEAIDLEGPSTTVTLPIGWTVEASVSGYTCVIVGVRTPIDTALKSVPLQFVSSQDEAVQVVCRSA